MKRPTVFYNVGEEGKDNTEEILKVHRREFVVVKSELESVLVKHYPADYLRVQREIVRYCVALTDNDPVGIINWMRIAVRDPVSFYNKNVRGQDLDRMSQFMKYRKEKDKEFESQVVDAVEKTANDIKYNNTEVTNEPVNFAL